MKKLLAVILALAMLMPIAVSAEDRDPIVGCWYMVFDADLYPEMAANFPGFDMIIGVYIFQKDGVIMSSETDIAGGTGTPVYAAAGKWSKSGDKYNYSIVGFGEGTAYIEGDDLFLGLDSVAQNMKMKIHRMVPLNPYKDYVYR